MNVSVLISLVLILTLVFPAVCASSSKADDLPDGFAVRYYETYIRLVRAYLQAEFYYIFKGEYPENLQVLLSPHEGFPLAPLAEEDITDPFSRFGLPFRYKITPEGISIAGIGPDGTWGGWERRDFPGFDDIVISRDNSAEMVWGYLHCAYNLSIVKGGIKHTDIFIESIKREDEKEKLTAVVKRLEERKVITEKPVESPVDLLEAAAKMKDGFLHSHDDKIKSTYFSPEETGLKNWKPFVFPENRFSMYGTFRLLQEISPQYLYLTVYLPNVFILEGRYWRELMAFSAYREQEGMEGLLEKSRHQLTSQGPEHMIIILPEKWFDDDAYNRLEKLIKEVFGPGSRKQHLIRTEKGIVITRFSGNWGFVLYLLEKFEGYLPDVEDYLELYSEIF